MESPVPVSEETSAQRQARIRREKRERKILDSGTSRLDKITSLSGRSAEGSSSPQFRSQANPTSPPNFDSPSTQHLDTGSQQLSASPSPSPLPRRGEMNGLDMFDMFRTGKIPPHMRPQPGDPEDPVSALIKQMMGNAPPPGAGEPDPTAGLASLLGMAQAPGDQEPAAPPPTSTYIWKIVHAIFALSLGLYVLFTEPFSGSRLGRTPLVATINQKQPNVFWVFATVELGLQSARFLLEKGRKESGMVGTVANFLPPPWNSRLRLVGTYSGIWTTLVSDAMVVIWILGVGAWWRGAVV